MELVYFKITNNCNLECRHCSQNSGPGKESLSLEEVRNVIDNLPFKTATIMISGGEVFTKKDLLYSTIEYIRKRRFATLPEVIVQTNAFWAKDKITIRNTLDELVELGMTSIEASAADSYHRLAGLDMKRPWLLAKEAEERSLGDKREYIRHMRVFPGGRALTMDSKYWGHSFFNQCKGLDQIAINYDGRVYPCTILVPGTELGDAKEEKVAKIIKRSMKRESLTILRGGNGLRKLAKKAGLDNKEIKEILALTKSGKCGLCSYLFSKGMIKL